MSETILSQTNTRYSLCQKYNYKGEIRCIAFEYIEGHSFFITGSADRSIKIWESDLKNKGIIQTLAGHGGTVLQLKYCSQIGTIVSCSIDKTIRTWTYKFLACLTL